ncbi:MAG: hypothetical protein U5K79_17550 [Cyclobacteriaceae bacterium]|nr:hypothetical protein [Cyclobacteriaceae bacterium]
MKTGLWSRALAIIDNNSRYHFLSLAILFLLINGFHYFRYGIVLMYDSYEYLRIAQDVVDGIYPDVHYRWYSGYVMYLWVINSMAGGFGIIVLGQYVFSALAVWALYHTSLSLWGSRSAAYLASCAFLVFLDISMWNSFVLAESLFISFTYISIYLLSILTTRSANVWRYILTGIIVTFTFFIKPTGVAMAGALLSVLVYALLTKFNSRLPALISGVVLILAFLLMINKMLVTYDIVDNYQKGELIFGISELDAQSTYNLLFVQPPDSLYIPSIMLPPLAKIGAFLIHHPVYWLKLFFGKMILHLAHVRPYWSVLHNLMSLLILLPAYYLFGRYILRVGLKNKTVLFAIAFMAIHTLSVSLTSVDWDGRFLLPMLPVLFTIAGRELSISIGTKYPIPQSEKP